MKRRHFLLIAALSLSLTTGACAATLTACGKDDTELVQLTPSVTGTYYVEENGTEKTIELNLSSFILNFGDGMLTGSYSSYENGTITLSFDSGATATATFDSGKLTLGYNGKTYVMFLKTNFTVTFNVDGGSEVAAQSVVNGKKATRPDTNPTKTDCTFIGWYTDDTYKTQFDFENTAITANTTVYARFISRDSKINVYTVTFDLGEGVATSIEPMKTLNRVLYELPEAPAKEGKKFLGWWISDYYDREKLSSKYEGQELYEDTVLYAVWEGDVPAVSVNAAGASWVFKGTNKSFDTVVKDASGKVLKEQHSATTSIAYDFDEALEGNYTVEVTVDGQTAVAYYKNKGLARATKLAVQDDYFTFDLDTKDPYLIVDFYLDLECGDDGHTHTHQPLNATAFDFSNCPMKEGGIRFRVTAEAVGYVSSTSEWFTLERGLEKVTGLTVDEMSDVIQWDAVEHAKSYALELSALGMDTVKTEVVGTSFDMRLLKPASWTIKVTPLNYTYNTPEAAEYTYDKQRLPSPSNFVITDTEITWDKVEGATGYRLYINGTAQTPDLNADTNTFAISEELFGETTTEYAVTVMALGTTGLETSLPNDPVYIHGNLQPPTYANGKVTWDAVVGMKRFGVKVGDGEEVFVENGRNTVNVTFDKSGPIDITVTGYSSDGQVLDSATTTVEVHVITFDTLDGKKTREYKADGDTITLPEAPTRTGYDFTQWNATSSSGGSDKGYDAGTSFTFDASTETGNVYAVWNPKKYTVSLIVGEGGVFAEDAQTEYEVTFGKGGVDFPVPECKIEGKEFMGWFTSASGGMQMTDNVGYLQGGWNIAQNATLYAQWGNTGVEYVLNTNGKEYIAKKGQGVNNLSTVTVLATYKGLPVTTLAGNAFDGCSSIKKLRLPSSLKTVIIPGESVSATGTSLSGGPYVSGSSFYGLNGLEEVEVYDAGGEKFLASFDGALYTMENDELNKLIYVPKARNRAGTFTVAEGTKELGDRVLTSFNLIEEVVIPSSVTYIGKGVFNSDYKLSKVTFLPAPNGEMGPELEVAAAFNYCYELREITFPKRLVSLSPEAFTSRYSTTTPLQNIYIQELGDTKDRKTNYYDLDGVLCKADELVLYPLEHEGTAYQTPSGISRIGDYAFRNAKNLNSVRFIATIEKVGVEAFYGCSNLKTLNFDQRATKDLEICEMAFYNCAMESVVLPPNLTKLGKCAFGNVSSLASVTVNSDRANIQFENGAFQSGSKNDTTGEITMGSVMSVTDLFIGAGVQTLNISGVFGSKLENVEVDPANPNYYSNDNVIYNKEVTQILFFPDGKTEFVIDDNLQKISAGTFKGRTALTSVTIGTGVTEIEDSAFEGCKGLTEIIFKAGGTEALSIGNKAFYNCGAMVNFEFNGRGGADITIGNDAFGLTFTIDRNLPSNVDTLTLPEGVKSVGKLAFASAASIKVVNLPASLTDIDFLEVGDMYPAGKITSIGVANISLFKTCLNLEQINVAEGNPNFTSINGVLYGKEENVITTLLLVPEKGQAGLMPEEFRDPEAEGEQRGYLEVPATVNKVADFALYSNYQIKRVKFLGEQESFTFGNSVFQAALLLKSVNLPHGITEVANSLFSGCSSMEEVEIPNTVETIRQKAFYNCRALTTVKFAAGNNALPLVIEDGTLVTASGGGEPTYTTTGAFFNCASLEEIKFPVRLQSIGNYTFYVVTSGQSRTTSKLKTVEVPASITNIGNYAFTGCSKLDTFLFKGEILGGTELTIGNYAFQNCSFAVNGFTLPAHVTSIGNYALQGTGLTELIIPAMLETLGTPGITTLTNLEFATMEEDGKQVNKLKALPASAFSSMKQLGSVNLEKCTSLTEIPASAFKATALTSIKIPAQIESIGASAFEDSRGLSSLTFLTDESGKSKVASIGNNAFKNTALTEFVFPTLDSGNLTLGTGLFEGCAQLTDLTISASVQDIGGALSKAPNLQNITVSDGSGVYIDAANHMILAKTSDANNTYKIASVYAAAEIDASGKCTLPSIYNGGTVTEIGEGAFAGQNAIRTVLIPETISHIGARAFSQCRGLVSVEFAPNSLLAAIDANAFEYTYSLEKIVLPNSVKAIGSNCFSISGLQEVTMPNELTAAAQNIFNGCKRLHTVHNISKVVKGDTALLDGYHMFNGCTALKNVSFAEGVTALPASIFSGCTALETIDLTGITSFMKYDSSATASRASDEIFYGCTSLREVVLDAKLTALPSKTFYNCTSLTSVYRSDTPKDQRVEGKVDISQITEFTSNYSSGSYSPFYGCSAVKEIDMRNVASFGTLTNIFINCKSLKKVILAGAGYTTLPNYMFYGCSSLKTVGYWDGAKIVVTDNEVVLPSKISYMGQYTFKDSGIEKITLPVDLKVLGSSATACTISAYSDLFYGCKSLKEVILPSGLTKMGQNVFRDCENLETIKYYDASGTVTGNDKEITLPVGLTMIGNYCFTNCKKITAIDLSKVTDIGTSGSGNADPTKAYGLFSGCEKLKYVKLNDSVTLLGAAMFYGCTSLTGEPDAEGNETLHLPTSLKATNTYTFYKSGLKTITLPTNVKYIGSTTAAATTTNASSYVFAECADLEKITVSASFEKIGGYAFNNCKKLESFKIANDAATKLLEIGTYAFQNCSSLTTIDLSKVTKFNGRSFLGCSSLETVDLSAVANAGLATNLFENCTSLTSVTLGDKITTLSNYMFKGCTALESINLNKVTNTGTYTFQDCTALTSVELGAALTTIGTYAFDGCTNLAKIYKSATAEDDRTEGKFDLDTVTSLGNYAFHNCKSLTEVVLKDSLTKIGNDMFYNCSSLEKINMPSSLTEISGEAFLNCSSLTELEIPASVKTIGNNLFVGCNNLKLTVNEANETFATNDNGWLVNKTNGTVLFVPYNTFGDDGSTTVTEANFADGAQLSSYMFNGYAAIQKVTLPSDLTSIPNYAFWNFKGSFGQDFAIPEGVTSIGNYAFLNCTGFTEIVIPEGVTTIGTNAFQNCTNLTKITLPSTLTSIGANAFDGCTSLSQIVFPEAPAEPAEGATGLTIGNYAFQNCAFAGNVVIPAGVTSIGNYAFKGCGDIVSIHFEAGLKTIGTSAFEGLHKLESVNIPYTLTSLGGNAFHDCVKLSTVTFDETPQGVDSVALSIAAGSASATPDDTYAFIDEFGVGYKGTFVGCPLLTSIELPSRLSSIGQYAFTGAKFESITISTGTLGSGAFMFSNLKSVVIGYKVTSIGGSAFGGCKELTTITFEETPEDVTPVNLVLTAGSNSATKSTGYAYFNEADQKYYSGVFIGCPKLGEVNMPSRVSTFGKHAFAFSGITKVNLAGIATIGDAAFYYCKRLIEVAVPYGTTSIGSNCFEGCDALMQIVLPVNTKAGTNAFIGWTKEQKVLIDVEGAELTATETASLWLANSMITDAIIGVTGVNYTLNP